MKNLPDDNDNVYVLATEYRKVGMENILDNLCQFLQNCLSQLQNQGSRDSETFNKRTVRLPPRVINDVIVEY